MGNKVEQLVVALSAREFSPQKRKTMAKSGSAMSDGSFPIPDVDALKRAIQSIGRAKDPEKAKAHIKSRAKALGATNLIPDDWKG